MIVDVGANRGQFALAARHWSPAATVISFEPLSVPADTFRDLFRDDAQVTLFQAAIAPVVGDAIMNVAQSDDSSSLLPITDLQERLFPDTVTADTERVRTAPLANFLAPDTIHGNALLKLDVQGYELEALQGCGPCLKKFRTIVVESSFVELYDGQALAHDVIRFLMDHRFRFSNMYSLKFMSGQVLQADLLFENSELDHA